MKNTLFFMIFAGLLMAGCTPHPKQAELKYPKAKKVDTVDTYFGHQVADPYRWLEDENSKDTKEWVKAENELTHSYLSKIPFREDLKKRLEQIWNYPKYGIPFKRGGLYFFFKNNGMQNQSVLYVQKTLTSEPEVLLDPNKLSEDGTVALSSLSVSKNGKYLAYSVARGGSDWNEILVMEIASRKMLSDHIQWVKFSGISWKGNGFFYSAYGEPKKGEELSQQNRFHKVYYHVLGTPQKDDRIIFENKKYPLRNYYAYTTRDEQFLIISESESTSGNALYAAKLNDVHRLHFVKLAKGFKYDYSVEGHLGNQLLVLTNEEAPFYKLIKIDFNHPSKRVVVLPEKNKEKEVLQSAGLVGGDLFAQYLKDASSRGYFYNTEGRFIRELPLPGIGTISGFSGLKGDNEAFFGFTSFTVPNTIYQINVTTGETQLMKQPEVDFNPDDFVTQQVFYKSKDGTRVPMFITHKKGLKLDGNNPTLLYGYGGFNISLTPGFSISRMAFLEQGGIYVMANIRGGGEYGEDWHEAGTKMHKQNVFDDFIAAAKYLITKKYTSSQKLAIMGGSNGGLLIGAVMTQQPQLFKVAIPMVGVMDMLRYQKFTIGWAWASDYGRSDDSEQMFEYLYHYSPLHNIKKGVVYPATLALTADHDDRVVPAHTFKFMATLQADASPVHPALVRIETKAGHGAGKPTTKQIDEATDIYSFIMYNLEMKPNFNHSK
ncbi:MAG: S9 family peptidase [Bacteroidales bacterium]|nr:S9 family peptidase [Bacteroidales bacterium]